MALDRLQARSVAAAVEPSVKNTTNDSVHWRVAGTERGELLAPPPTEEPLPALSPMDK